MALFSAEQTACSSVCVVQTTLHVILWAESHGQLKSQVTEGCVVVMQL